MNLYIDIAISLILIFLIFSIVVYVLQELIAINLKYRGRMLWQSLARALDGIVLPGKRNLSAVSTAMAAPANTPLTNLLFGHAQIQTLQKDLTTLPSYIPSSNFALGLIDIVAQNAPMRSGNLFTDFTAGLPVFTAKFAPKGAAIPSPMADVLNTLSGISANIKELQSAIEKWFNEYMNRVSGWYQSHTVVTIRLIAVGITLAFNLNSIRLIKDIADNSALRTNLVGISEKLVDHPESVNGFLNKSFKNQNDSIDQQYAPALKAAAGNAAKTDSLNQVVYDAKAKAAALYTSLNAHAIDSLTKTLSAVNLPIGWRTDFLDKECRINDGFWISVRSIVLILLGWLITAGSLSMGAPFWFNLLIQLVNIRRAGVKPGGDKKK